MQRLMYHIFLCTLLIHASPWLCCSASPHNLPSAAEVIHKVIERAKWSEQHDFERQYAFVKATQSDELDDRGRVIRRREKTVQVIPAADGQTRVKLDAAAKRLTGKEIKSIASTQLEHPRAEHPSSKPAQRTRIELTEELIQRFDFEVKRREYVGRRVALVLQFTPKPGDLPVRKLQDRFINRATGTIWVDEKDFELVKAEVRLIEPVTIAGGVAGAIQAFRYLLERARIDDGVWLLKQTDLLIRGRKFLAPVHTRKVERWTDYQKVIDAR